MEPRLLRQLVLQAEKEVAGGPVEHAIAYNASGIEVLNKRGSVDDVSLTKADEAMLLDASVVHNHPLEHLENGAIIKDIPPSADDLKVLLICHAREVRIVTQNYRYILRALPDARYSTAGRRLRAIRDRWQTEYNRLWKQRYDRLVKRHGEPLSGLADVAFCEKIPDDAHKAWLKIAPRYCLYYRREARL